MIRFTIDGREVAVAEGRTVLDGARQLGLDIPTLCYLERCGPMTSCLVCVVRVTLNGRTSVMPSCGLVAVEGMEVESETPAVHELRRSALELLLSDHVGDCLSPCARICPLGLNIPQMLREVQAGRVAEATTTIRAALALPAVLGRLCHRPCENGCRRAGCDSSAAIQEVERFVADSSQREPTPLLPPKAMASGRRVAIVGAGPTGLAAAYQLARRGHACVVFDRNTEGGGTLREEVAAGRLPAEVLRREIADLAALGIEFRWGVDVGGSPTLAGLRAEFDAVFLALGENVASDRERLGVAGTTAGVKVVQAEAMLTSVPGVFSGGSAVRPVKQIIRAMAEGQMAAEAMDEFLSGRLPRKAPKRFSSLMGRLEREELSRFAGGASPGSRVVPSGGAAAGYTATEAACESARCLHCDCRSAGHCSLQHYSQVYGAEFGRFPRQRRTFEQHLHPGRVLFEPGKCILCGICVHIASEAAEPLGLTFVGRGFDVRVAAPLNEAFEHGLEKVARECVEACPTGAIAFAADTDQHAFPRPGPGGAAVAGCAGCGGGDGDGAY